jgi:hypothetical protein
MTFDNLFKLCLENRPQVEQIPIEFYPHPKNPVIKIRKPIDWRNLKVGRYYGDGDVQRYVHDLHKEFVDDDRIDGTFLMMEIDPASIESSEWDIDEEKVQEFSELTTEIPPIVLDEDGSIIDGGHRLEAAKMLNMSTIKVLKQV